MWDGVAQDVRQALRSFRRSPWFTFVAVATLGVGIGVNVAVFTIVNAVLFNGFPLVEANDRIVYVDSREGGQFCCVSYPDFRDWRAQAESFEDMGAVADLRVTLEDEGGLPETYSATLVTSGVFPLLRQAPLFGRNFRPRDESPAAPAVAILSHAFWQRRYGASDAILGRTIRLNGEPTTIIGVMPAGFSFPQSQDLWMPLRPTAQVDQRGARGLWFAFGRLAAGATPDSAAAELDAIGRRLAEQYPRTNRGVRPTIHSVQDFFFGSNASAVYGAMLGAVGFVLLIACANLANLLLARAISRSNEVSVRIALGGSRARILRQSLIESLLLSLAGGAVGWWAAGLSVRLYVASASGPAWFERVLDYSMDARVFVYALVVAVATGLLFGALPALRLSRLDIGGMLKQGGRNASGSRRNKKLSSALVAAEAALAIMLLAASGVLLRSFLNVYSADAGVRADHVLTALLRLPATDYPDAAARVSFFSELRDRLAGLAAVESVALADTLPAWGAATHPFELEGAESTDDERRPRVGAVRVSPDYFSTLGAPMQSGRTIQTADGEAGPAAALVNQRFAQMHWPGAEPIGKRLRLWSDGAPGPWLTVVGVAPNIVQNDATRQRFDPLVYTPYRSQTPQAMWVLIKTSGAASALANPFRQELQQIAPGLSIWLGPFDLEQRMAANYRSEGVQSALFLAFAAIALLLAAVGLYAVIAHAVGEQTKEIGVRMALGAGRRDVLSTVFALGMRPLAAGLLLGLAGSFLVNRALASQLVGVSPADPVTLLAAAAALLFAALLGCWIPARRALRVDPVVALREN
ncbi:MAG: ABC transporter permease [Bryobacterales bacterium]